MKLYHHPISSSSRKAVMTSFLLGSELELVSVDLLGGKTQAPDYLKINPMGKLPTLVDGELTLWESHAIMQYLADKAPGNTLYPSDTTARTDVNRWLFWASSHWSPMMAILVNQNFLKKMLGRGDPDPVLVGFAEGELARFGKVLDEHLAARNWVCGHTMTLADLALVAPLMYEVPAKLPVATLANVQRWLRRIQDLDVWKKTTPSLA
jgi:glutathione S-transferase